MDCRGVRDACLGSVISISSFRCRLHGCVPLVKIRQDVRAFSVCRSAMKRFCFQVHLRSFHSVNICMEVTGQDTEHGHPSRSPSRSLPISVPQKQGQFWLLARRQRPHLCPAYLRNTLAHYKHWQVRVELIYYKQKLGSQKKNLESLLIFETLDHVSEDKLRGKEEGRKHSSLENVCI